MNLGLELYAYLDSPMHRWDARQKLIGLATLIFAFSLVQELRLVPVMLLITLIIFALSRLPWAYLWERLRYPGMFLLVVAVLLPLFSGQTILASFGPLSLRLEGFLAMIIMVTKSLSILTISLVLFSSAPFLTSLKAIRALGLPSILADMMLLSYRYFFEIGQDFSKMETAMWLRGFQIKAYDRRSLQSMAALAGSLLVRSYERSERVYKAMLLRGYGHAPSSKVSEEFQARPPDLMATALVVVVALGLVLAQLSLGGLVIY